MSDQVRRQEDGVPPHVPADTEQLGQQQADDNADPLSQNLFRGRVEDAMPIPEGESGMQGGQEEEQSQKKAHPTSSGSCVEQG